MATTSSSEIGSCVDCSLRRSSMVSVSWVSARSCAHSLRVKRRNGDSSDWSAARFIRTLSLEPVGPRTYWTAISLRSRRLFLVTTLCGPFAQFVHDRRQVHPPGAEHDEKVVENIGRLGADGALILCRGGDREFDRFFSEFARAIRGALIEQAASVGGLSARLGALVDRSREFTQCELRIGSVLLAHRPLSLGARPAATGGPWQCTRAERFLTRLSRGP